MASLTRPPCYTSSEEAWTVRDLTWEPAVVALKLLTVTELKPAQPTETVLARTSTFVYIIHADIHMLKLLEGNLSWRARALTIDSMLRYCFRVQALLSDTYVKIKQSCSPFFYWDAMGSGKCSAATQWLSTVLPISSHSITNQVKIKIN